VQIMRRPNPTSAGAVYSGTPHINISINRNAIGQNNDIYKTERRMREQSLRYINMNIVKTIFYKLRSIKQRAAWV